MQKPRELERKRFLDVYSACLAYIVSLLQKNGITRITPDYGDGPLCFNVNSREGYTELIAELRLADIEDDRTHLVAVGSDGTEYDLGTDYDGQDNYVLSDLHALMSAVERRVTAILSSLIPPEKNPTQESCIERLRHWLGPDGSCTFEHGVTGPVLLSGETVSFFDSDTIFTYDESKRIWRHPIDVFPATDLQRLIRAVNDYILHINNNC